jgi:ammonium transporter, Amt family
MIATESMDLTTTGTLAALLLIAGRAGMALGHTGLTRSKNAGNTVSLHFLAFAISIVAYFLIGTLFGSTPIKFALAGASAAQMLQFLALAIALSFGVAIPIGALSERWRLKSFVVITTLLAAVVFPLFAGGCSGDGRLAKLIAGALGRVPVDSGGAAFIHLLGGVIAMVGIKALGPRLGKYDRGRPHAFFGHNVPMTMLGVFLMTMAWPATLMVFGTPGVNLVAVAANSVLAAAAGTLASAFYIGKKYGKPDPSMITSGAIAGMVAISGGAAYFPLWAALLIGLIAGGIVAWCIVFLEARGIDDPAGVVSIHGVGGLWGTVAVGLFANGAVQGIFYGDGRQLLAQLILVVLCVAWGSIAGALLFAIVGKVAGPNRVPGFIESAGLDTHEMGLPAYPEFVSMSAERTSGS